MLSLPKLSETASMQPILYAAIFIQILTKFTFQNFQECICGIQNLIAITEPNEDLKNAILKLSSEIAAKINLGLNTVWESEKVATNNQLTLIKIKVILEQIFRSASSRCMSDSVEKIEILERGKKDLLNCETIFRLIGIDTSSDSNFDIILRCLNKEIQEYETQSESEMVYLYYKNSDSDLN
jgi:hypothetical protein